ncbi:hypothetical protein OHA77_40745 [Streptosporangium sp. NBC_01639]|uniref:hypothetical protein n=1 Tax=Streptosporangium sp. NBC_01639 TaxID=2975948 RepID=UPI0038689EC5|nr:hypothetical protein OHA77_40745 [Streptosporangium sp. NBC_01639]
MTFLIAAVVLVGVLCAFDLLLTFAVLRRLREHTAELARLAEGTQFISYDPGALVGRTLPWADTDTDGVDRPELVAFFDANCDACHKHAPQFAVTARTQAAMAVISGAGPRADDLVQVVAGVSSVITAERADSLVKAVGVEAFPTFLRVGQDGTIVAAHMELAALAEMASAK